jgi:hypothetical protein
MHRQRNFKGRRRSYDLGSALTKLDSRRPKRLENKLVLVPSLRFMGRLQAEDAMKDGISYRIPKEFVEWVFPEDAPLYVYPFVADPIYGFTCGDYADVRYLELEAMAVHASECYYDELGFDEEGSRPANRAAALAIHQKLVATKPLVLRLHGEDRFADATPSYFRNIIGSSERFLWSYAANFRKIIAPLMKDALAAGTDLRPVCRSLATGSGKLLHALSLRDKESLKLVLATISRPGFLAMLYALHASTQSERNNVLEQLTDAEQVDQLTVGSRLKAGSWIGTGALKAQPAPEAAEQVTALLATGLLIADMEQQKLSLSDFAKRTLDVLPDQCDDPDWKLSLFHEDGTIPLTLSKDADRWIMSFFERARAVV